MAAIRQKNTMTRKWQRAISTDEKRRIKTMINLLKKLIEESVWRERNDEWNRFLGNTNDDYEQFWRLTKSLRGKHPNSLMDLRDVNGTSLNNDLEKANALAEVFGRAYTTTAHITHPHDNKVYEFMHKFHGRIVNCDTIDHIENDEIRNIIGLTRPFKAAGEDGVINILLEHLPDSAIALVGSIFNECLRTSYWPAAFRIAKIVAIPKPGKPRESVINYRPISLLNSLGKTFEKLINARISRFAIENNVFSPVQFGFRPQHSSTHQVLRVSKWIQPNRANRRSIGLVLFASRRPSTRCGMMASFTRLIDVGFHYTFAK